VSAGWALHQVKPYSDMIATWVTILGAFVGAFVALSEYHDKVHHEAVSATLGYEQRYSTSPILDARNRLDAFWLPKASDVTAATQGGDAPLIKYVLQALNNSPSAMADTSMVVTFFEGLATCVCARLCDSQSAVQLFGKDAFDLYGLNYPYIQAQRQLLQDRGYGEGLNILAKASQSGGSSITTLCGSL
jgi:hypothetical protein